METSANYRYSDIFPYQISTTPVIDKLIKYIGVLEMHAVRIGMFNHFVVQKHLKRLQIGTIRLDVNLCTVESMYSRISSWLFNFP